MTDDKIIEAVARGIYEARRAKDETNRNYWLSWEQLPDIEPYVVETYRSEARVAITAHKAALAEDGFVIHRFHDWGGAGRRPYCLRCGVVSGGVLDVASCVTREATSPPPAEP